MEAMLKTAMQSQVLLLPSASASPHHHQLDGVRTGLNQLEKALQDISEIKTGMAEMEEALEGVPEYWDRLREVGPSCSQFT